MLGHTHHPTLGYPYAITAINLAASVCELTTSNQLDQQYLHMMADGGGVVLFYKVFGECNEAGPMGPALPSPQGVLSCVCIFHNCPK